MCPSGYRIASIIRIGLLLLSGLNPVPAIAENAEQPGLAAGTVLQGIQITEKETVIEVQIDFAQSLQYLHHFPPNAGEILQIQLQLPVEHLQDDLTAAAPAAGNATPQDFPPPTAQRESMAPPANDVVPLVNVTYEGDVPGGPFLTLRFRSVVEYTVAGGAGGTSLIVAVNKDPGSVAAGIGAEDGQAVLPEQQLDQMMEEIRQALAREEHGRAIQLLSKLLQLPSHAYLQEAKELIGVAREKKGQVARAMLEYQEYLRLYPEGEGAERVKNRLAAIDLAQVEPREKLKEVKTKTTGEIDTFGRFSQRYYGSLSEMESSPSTYRSTLTSYLNASSRYRNDEYDVRGNFNAYGVRAFAGEGHSKNEIDTAYVDIKNRLKNYSAIAGLQSTNKGGIFGRFWGALASYEFLPKYELTATVGKPFVYSSGDDIGNRIFYGTSLSVGSFIENWDGNVYYIKQNINGIVDRQAVGGDVRYVDNAYSLFASLDYDVSYRALNLVFLRAGWKANEQTRIDVNYNFRQSPLLFTSSALQSEGFSKFKQLQDVATESEIRDKARDIVSLSRMLTISAVYDIDQNNQINADWTRSSIDGKPAVALLKCQSMSCDADTSTVPAQAKYGPENSYSIQYIASNYFVERDLHILGGQFSAGADRSQTSVFLRSRLPYDEQWHLGPRIQFNLTRNDIDGSKAMHPSVALKADYRWKKKVNFEAELGYDLDRYSGGNNVNASRTTIYFGYDIDF